MAGPGPWPGYAAVVREDDVAPDLRRAAASVQTISHWYHSMYSLTAQNWLRSYFVGQILMLPMDQALDAPQRAAEAINRAFPSLRLDVAALGSHTPHLNAAVESHPAIRDDVDASVCQWLASTYFGPDLARLASLLVTARERTGFNLLRPTPPAEPATPDEMLEALVRQLGGDPCQGSANSSGQSS